MPKVTDRGSQLTHSHVQSPRVSVMESFPTFLQQPPSLLAQAATFQTWQPQVKPPQSLVSDSDLGDPVFEPVPAVSKHKDDVCTY